MAVILMLLMLFQSCVLYKSTSITIDQAVKNECKVKVKTNNNEILKFKSIGVENGNYYGVKRNTGKMARIPLETEAIVSIREKDKVSSTVLTIAIPIFMIVGVAIMVEDSLSLELESY